MRPAPLDRPCPAGPGDAPQGLRPRMLTASVRSRPPPQVPGFFSGVSHLAGCACCARDSALAGRRARKEGLLVATPGPPSSVSGTRGRSPCVKARCAPSLQSRPAAPAGRVSSSPGAGAPGPPASTSLRALRSAALTLAPGSLGEGHPPRGARGTRQQEADMRTTDTPPRPAHRRGLARPGRRRPGLPAPRPLQRVDRYTGEIRSSRIGRGMPPVLLVWLRRRPSGSG
jgi:hypothetical protein